MWLERLAKQRKGNLQGRDKERGSCCFLSSARGGSVIRSASESRKGFPAPGLRLPSHTQTWNRLGVPAPRQPLPPFLDVRRSPAGPGQPSPSSKVGREDPRPAPPCGSRPAAARLRDLGPAGSRGGAGGGETRGAPPLPRPGSASPSRSVAPTRAAPPAKTRRSGFCAPRPPPPPQCGPNGPALGGEGGPERERTRPHAGPPSRAAPPLRDPGRSAAAVGRALPGAVRLPRRAAARARRPSPGSAVTCPRLWARSRGRVRATPGQGLGAGRGGCGAGSVGGLLGTWEFQALPALALPPVPTPPPPRDVFGVFWTPS